MGLPWVRMDTNLPSHDKILRLLADPSPKRWQAAASYQFSIEWSGGQGTDGVIPKAALPFVHATAASARLLVTYELWDELGVTGWTIRNFAIRQELDVVAEGKRAARSLAGRKAACERWHDPGCECWRRLDTTSRNGGANRA